MKVLKNARFKRISTFTAALFLLVSTFTAFGPLFLSKTAHAAPSPEIVYDALASDTPSTNHDSLGYQATRTAEFGDLITLDGTNRVLDEVSVTLSNWAKYSSYSLNPTYSGNSTSWSQPITLKVYATDVDGSGVPTTVLAQKTQSFDIPWRPESHPDCAATKNGTGWKEGDTCFNYSGIAKNITFDLSDLNVTLPNQVVLGISYNTQSYGSAPTGQVGPYNSLNVAIPNAQVVSVGSNDDSVFWNSTYAGRAAGFRVDEGWAPNGTVAFRVTALPANTAPMVSFVSPTPTENSFVSGTITGKIMAEDDYGMGSYYIRFWKNAFESGIDNLIANCQSAPGGFAFGTSLTTDCSYDTTTLADGTTLVLSAQVLDGHGAWGSVLRSFTVDNTKPSVAITSPTANSNVEGPFTIQGTATDGGSGIDRVEIVVNKWVNGVFSGRVVDFELANLSGNNFSYNVPALDFLENGYYALRAIAYDKAGNSKTAGHNVFVVDTTDPTIDITNLVVSTGKLLSFDLTAKDAGAGLQVVAANIYNENNTGDPIIRLGKNSSGGNTGTTRLNEPYAGLPAGTEQFVTSINGVDVSGLASGTYTLRAFARDHAGNELRFKLVKFTVDNTAPIVSVDTLSSTTSTPTITGSVNDTTATVMLTIGGDAPVPVTVNPDGSWFYDVTTPLSNGTYDLTVTATDPAGNVANDTGTLTINVSITIPSTDSQTGGDSEGAPQTFALAGPITTNPADNTGVLGENTQGDEEDEDAGIAGANTLRNVAAADTDADDGLIFGIAWYWWLLILAALGVLTWGIVAAVRRRDSEA